MAWVNELAYWVLLAQEAPKPEAQEVADPGIFGGLTGLMLPIAAIMVLYIFMMVLPQRREEQRSKNMLGALKKNDRVVTAGGIVATIANVQQDSDHVTLRIDETTNTKMKVLRSSITRILGDESTQESGETTK